MKTLSRLPINMEDPKIRKASIIIGGAITSGLTIRLISCLLSRHSKKKGGAAAAAAGGGGGGGRSSHSKTSAALGSIPVDEQQRRIEAFRSVPFREDCPTSTNLMVPSYAGRREIVDRCHCKITISGGAGGKDKKIECFDFVTFDYHSFSTDPDIVDVARKVICAYGVGSCGPRGFYGTVKPHLDVEKDLAAFLNAEAAVVYSFSYATIATLISCFASRGDYIVMDNEVNSAVEEGCSLSRANLMRYRHVDMEDLERVLAEVVAKDSKTGLHRRLIVTEGVFLQNGSICPLKDIKALADKYKFRIILDDSYGFGAIGEKGRGTPEYCGMTVSDVDVYVGCLHAGMGGVGGFCAGRKAMVNFQCLAASAYVFSASLPPYVTASVSAVLRTLQNDTSFISLLGSKSAQFRKSLREGMPKLKDIIICGAETSPIVVLRVEAAYRARYGDEEVEDRLQKVVNTAEAQKMAISRIIFTKDERNDNEPSLRIVMKSQVAIADLKAAAATIADVLTRIIT